MAIQNDNTLVTKGDLKSLYTDKIAPYLGGGISYYHTDRTGEELRSAYAVLDADWTTSLNQKVPFIKKSGSLIQPSNGSFTIPDGTRVEILINISQIPVSGTAQPDVVYSVYNDTDSEFISSIKSIDPWQTQGYSHDNTFIVQWTNDLGYNVDISIRPSNIGTTGKMRSDYSSFTIKEIGRIVDPVKYVSNNSDLQETPVGNIISYMGNSVPKHYLACDGTTYSIGTYPELEAFIIDEFGSINYFGGDGASTWAVPDLRGEFLRGTGANSHENQGNGGNVGAHQNATEIPLTGTTTNNRFIAARYDSSGDATPIYIDSRTGKTSSVHLLMTGSTVTAPSEYQTKGTVRPTNTSVKYCIKYESTFHAFFANAAYKVSVAASVTSHSGAAIAITLDNSDIIGDASLVSGNSFIAPLDGLYLIGMNWSNNGVWEQNYMINVNGADVYHVVGIGVTDMLQLQKGDVVTIKTSKTSAQSGRASFALVTSNYNPTIVSADSIYSENEQMIGYWKDGKPLYQKTVTGTTGNKNSWNTFVSLNSDCDIKTADAYLQDTTPGWLKAGFSKGAVFDIFFHDNIFQTYVEDASMVNRPAFVILQYTKTTDTASSLQIENSLLLNRPDLWVAGTEYHFGGGLYGQRFTGTPNIASGNKLDVTLFATSIAKIVSSGGTYGGSTSWSDYGSPIISGTSPFSIVANASIIKASSDAMLLRIINYSWSNNITQYDIWLTYRKA